MSYQVIARKYRPQRFSEVVGQEHVAQTLSRAIEQKRIAHAYLFCGPRGTGKTTLARIFAKCLNCTGGPRVDFDDHDQKCQEIAEGRSLDVFEIDGASNNGVEQVRELRETCKYAPASSKFKIYIIDEVHMLSTAAFNALLKTLEEPPEHVKFMFATTDPEKVLPTILSRCQRFDLRRIPAALIAKHLTLIAGKENVNIAPAALYAIARGAEGAMRDAESTLDQLISFCGGKIEEADVLSMFGLTAQGQLLDLARAILAGEIEGALRQLNDLAGRGKDLGRLLTDLLNHFRNLLIFQVSRGDLTMIEVSEAEAAALAEQSKLAGSEGFTRILEVFGEAERRLRDAASKKIVIEVALLKAIEARNAASIDTILKQLNNLRDGNPAPASPADAGGQRPRREAPAPPTSAQPNMTPLPESREPEKLPLATAIMQPEPAATSLADGNLQTLWAKLVEAVGRASPFTRTYLLEAHPVSFNKNLFVIGFDPEFEDHIGLVDNTRNHALLQTKMQEIGHANIQFKFVKAEAPIPRQAPEPEAVAPGVPAPTAPKPILPTKAAARPGRERSNSTAFDKNDFKNDPLIQKALEIFKGQIVEVRA
jgi:DNA polymerase-3 subunit gamma/tau